MQTQLEHALRATIRARITWVSHGYQCTCGCSDRLENAVRTSNEARLNSHISEQECERIHERVRAEFP